MNKITFNKDQIIDKRIDVSFCKKFFKQQDRNENKCNCFILSKDKLGKVECPYGYACAHGAYTIYCGFLSEDIGNHRLIRNRNKYLNVKQEKIIPSESYDIIMNIVNNCDYCTIASQTAHDLIHLSGQLKTLIDETNRTRIDSLVQSIIREYQKYISAIDTYQKNSVSISQRFGNVELLLLDSENKYWEEKKQNYSKLIDAVYDISSRISKLLEDVNYEENYKGQYAVLSLISIQSIFYYRIKYHRITVDEMLGVINYEADVSHYYNWHKVLKKLANILSYQAKLKNAHFTFDGNTYEKFKAKENLFLALYILLENSIKYCVPDLDNTIVIKFFDNNGMCTISIKNSSNFSF